MCGSLHLVCGKVCERRSPGNAILDQSTTQNVGHQSFRCGSRHLVCGKVCERRTPGKVILDLLRWWVLTAVCYWDTSECCVSWDARQRIIYRLRPRYDCKSFPTSAITRKKMSEEKKLNHNLEKYMVMQKQHLHKKEEVGVDLCSSCWRWPDVGS